MKNADVSKEKLNLFRNAFNKAKDRYLNELSDYLRFKSVSTDPAFNSETLKCASWLANHLRNLGFEVDELETVGKPCVFAKHSGNRQAPSVLYYGHYDVQPPDPLELWKSDPFEPVIEGGKIRARGAQDNKGQTFYVLKAIETLLQMKELPPMKLLIEGEEECGSLGITKALPDWSSKLTSDLLMVCDTGTITEELGTITMGLRGIFHLEIEISGAASDLHSGIFGGAAPNPAHEVARLIASLHDEKGKIAIPNFYDDLEEVDPLDLKIAEAFPVSDEWFKSQTGALPRGGEVDLSVQIRRGFRPAIDINGLTSGYQGAGGKTVIASKASFKLSCRTAKGQDPDRLMKLATQYLEAKTNPAFKFRIIESKVGGSAFSLSAKSKEVALASQVLQLIYDREPILMWEGASIPIIPDLQLASGGVPILVGFGLQEDNIHAPNESFSLLQFERGFLYAALLLSSI